MSITTRTKVGQLAAEHPLATRVLARHGIDFCCGGGLKLQDACARKGLDADRILEEIRSELESSDVSPQRWDQAPLGDLIEHILVAYHQPLREELPRLESMARKVVRVHGDKDPDRLPELLSVYLGLETDLQQHMDKEEQVLFPMIQQGQGALAEAPVAMMVHEHDSAADALRRLRTLTDGYQTPEGACNTWRALWHGMAALEESLHHHIHLENNVLFPRALEA